MALSRTMSRGWWLLFATAGPSLFVALYLGIRFGFSWAVGVMVAASAVGVSVAIGYYARRISPSGILDLRQQSWAFVFGDTLCLAPILGLTAQVWGSARVSSVFAEWWWITLMVICGILVGLIMTSVDQKRYRDHDALAAYKEPDKQWHDKPVVWTIAALIGTATVPVLLTNCSERLVIIGLAVVYAGLLVVDEIRGVNPRWQYALDD